MDIVEDIIVAAIAKSAAVCDIFISPVIYKYIFIRKPYFTFNPTGKL